MGGLSGGVGEGAWEGWWPCVTVRIGCSVLNRECRGDVEIPILSGVVYSVACRDLGVIWGVGGLVLVLLEAWHECARRSQRC